MRRALIVGGSGQVGIALAVRLCADGWDVALGCRCPPATKGPWRRVVLDTSETKALQDTVTQECDLLISCIAFDGADARELLKLQSSTEPIVAMSSASVYQDDPGRTLDEAQSCGFPNFDDPITEQTSTVGAGLETFSTRKMQMEHELLSSASIPVTVLRPCAIHGPFSKHARECWFVKRLSDGRPQIPMAYGGLSQIQNNLRICNL